MILERFLFVTPTQYDLLIMHTFQWTNLVMMIDIYVNEHNLTVILQLLRFGNCLHRRHEQLLTLL